MNRLFLIVVFALAISLLGVCHGFAVEMPLVHKPLSGQMLPPPGQSMTLTLLLPQTKDLSLKARALVVIDGEAIDLAMDGALDELDRTVFKTEIRAPLSDLSYQFFITGSGDRLVTSEKYRSTRPCLPDIKLTESTLPAKLSETEAGRLMVDRSKGLERDIQAYSHNLEILKDLQARIK